ncbi:hypothetical protein LCGC14_3009790 [marine sediment metagenome]|uniref:Uncharacterized protein n=1 Tax=marine sediment metagenome TaxID=412755 RepID=A0A0F8ZPS9_9ZZZZ
MGRKETDIVFSWSLILKYFGTGAVIIIFAFILISYSDSFILKVFACIIGITGLVMLFLPIFTGFGGKGLCPVCSAEVEVILGKEPYIFCKNCGEYIEASNKKLWQMDINHVADDPKFVVLTPWDDLNFATVPTIPLPSSGPPVDLSLIDKKGQDRVLSAIWPKGCCVCGKQATRKESVMQVVIKPPEGIGRVRDEQITLKAESIPHCDEHTKGVKFGRIRSLEGWYLMFRSYAYRNKFQEMNPC